MNERVFDVMAINSIYERYFVYSPTQAEELTRTENIGRVDPRRKFKLGTVVVNGVAREYTEIVTSLARARYADAKLVAKGDIRTIKFTEHSF